MNHLILDATKSTPSVHFDAATGVLELKGKSYPENAARYYEPILQWVNECLNECEDKGIVLNLEMIYLNSSSSKAFLNLFDMLDRFAKKGRKVVINWRYLEDNDTALECGEEFMEDLEAVTFNLVKIENE
ncbi:DUF1987 domain-containing protein [Desulfomonile tiedjei]|uniref:SiaC family regulatory phosphoprotein domain-containing protein n=1 Tax=Desulfomonile tiedjei (strain ATCC 49306 / DSM 6799 / DCB-1) TaxID=706587 RepID=I4C9G0_DESTA|nr:DUF1987 domain-containing protein [Desulfomonile tiedjei]AFM26201.1 protein of unknown function (DUF1987) [Desulfomonile tiedjei DSM 6799]